MSTMSEFNDAVKSGGKALTSHHSYPWYDPQSDSLRPITLKEEPPPSQSSPSEPLNLGWLNALSLIIQYLVYFALAAAIAAVCYFIIKAFLNRQKDEAQGEPIPEAGRARRIEALPMNLDEKEADLLAAARRYLAEQNFAKAIVCYFGYQLVELDHRQIIHLTQGKTNRQYLREMGQRRQLREIVGDTMVVSEDAYFGHHAPAAERFNACWSRLAEFQKLVKQEV
jgi:hypothetical protein